MRVVLLVALLSLSLLYDGDAMSVADKGLESVTFGPEGLYIQESFR